MKNTQQCADFLLSLRLNREKTAHIPDTFRPATIQDGYAAQDLLVSQLLDEHGAKLVGYKIGCTSTYAQELLGVDEPFYGQLQSHDIYQSQVELAASDFRARIIEPEIGFRIKQDVPHANIPYTAESIRPYIGAAFPTIEIVNPSYEDFGTVGGPSLVADNAVWGVSIVGQSIPDWQMINFAAVEVKLFLNDKLIEEGIGSNALGDPLNVVAWLANTLQSHGKTLAANALISTGTTTNVYAAQAGDSIRAEYARLGSVEVGFCL